jgi:tetratricopeptide (TPR) repeat protein
MTTPPGDGPGAGGAATSEGDSEGDAEGERWHRVRALFEDAVERDPAAWPGFIATAADDERELLASLLAADEITDPLLDRTPDQLAADLLDLDEPVPDRVGQYRVLRLLGRGGMGQVLLARRDDAAHDREVAIKLVRRGMDSEDVLRRFRAERQILARLTHANIARILDGGIAADGRPYFVLEYVPGSPITEYAATHDLPLADRLRLFADTCSAVQHAHERGVIHRDLKPRNIIVAEGASPGEATVKLLDFGIAKLLDATTLDLTVALTHTGSRLMTPEYASPEQLVGGPVGPTSDVYGLGVVLYELLTGRRPHDLKGLAPAAAERVVCDTDPARPATGDAGRIPPALQAIVLMALRKEPERRYADAGDLGDDVRRFLAGEAVRARGDAISYRVGTLVRRRRAGLALLVATAGVAVGVVGMMRGGDGAAPPGLSAAADPIALVVLPFRYTGPEGQELLADGLTEAVRGHLAGLASLTVVSHARAVQYRGTDRTAQDIGTELGVAYVLKGDARFDRATEPSGRVVVTTRLIRVADDRTVWDGAFEHAMARFFAMQSALARDVAQALGLKAPDVAWSALVTAATPDLEAYRFYLRGNDFLSFNEDEARLRLAEESYLQAVARDSTFAEAWAKLSATHTQLWFHRYDTSDDRLERARDAAERALRHHPGLPESYYALGLFLYQGRGDLRQAQRYFEQALELRPNYVDGLFGLATVLRRQGRMEEALATFERLTVLDPLDANFRFSAAFTRQLLRDYEASERLYEIVMERGADLPMLYVTRAHLALARTGSVAEATRVLGEGAGAAVDNDFTRFAAADLDLMRGRYREVLRRAASWSTDVLDSQPWYVPVAWLRASAYRGLGEPDSARIQEDLARRLLEDRISDHPNDARAHGTLGRIYATMGRHDEAVRHANLAVELLPLSHDAVLAPFRLEDLAAVYVLTGRHDEAITTLRTLLSVPGMLSVRHLHADPRWAPLREHPRFPPVS